MFGQLNLTPILHSDIKMYISWSSKSVTIIWDILRHKKHPQRTSRYHRVHMDTHAFQEDHVKFMQDSPGHLKEHYAPACGQRN